MSGPTIQSGNALAAGIRADFDRTYDQETTNSAQILNGIMQMGVPSDKRTETYGVHETMPYPERWHLGSDIPMEGSATKSMSVTNLKFGKGIEWYIDDRKDNQIADLRTKATALGGNFATLPIKAAVEIITASASLIDAIPNSPDGASLFSATDGDSAARFGVSGGNIHTGTGTTAAQIRADFYDTVERIATFLNPKGEPFWENNTMGSSWVVLYPTHLMGNFAEAFKTELIQGSSAAPSNVILASGFNIRLQDTPRQGSSDNDWSIHRTDANVSPLFQQVREELVVTQQTEQSSDIARKEAKEGVHYHTRQGYGVNVPYMSCKVNNA